MKPRSAKNKGKRLQNKVRDLILEKFNSKLEPDDVRSITMGDSGEDILLSPAARRVFPFSVECKSQEHLSIWGALKQAEDNSGDHLPFLFNFCQAKPIVLYLNPHSFITSIHLSK